MTPREEHLRAVLTMPAHVADVRSPVLDRLAPPSAFDAARVAGAVASIAGIRLDPGARHVAFTSFDGARRAVVAVHRFAPPSDASAEVVVIAERFAFTRNALFAALDLLAFELGLNELTARIASDDARAQRFARRLGFKIEGPSTLDDGRPASAWRLTLDDLFASPAITKPARAVEPAPARH